MKVRQCIFINGSWINDSPLKCDISASLIFIFGNIKDNDSQEVIESINNAHKNAVIVGCTTSGEIGNNQLLENSLSLTLIEFENSTVCSTSIPAQESQTSFDIGKEVAQRMPKKNSSTLWYYQKGFL